MGAGRGIAVGLTVDGAGVVGWEVGEPGVGGGMGRAEGEGIGSFDGSAVGDGVGSAEGDGVAT